MDEQELIAFARAHAPCYIYRRAEIVRLADALQAALEGFELLYSVKANPFPEIVSLLAKRGFGADAASVGEVRLAAACGIAPEDIYFSAPGRTQADFSSALRQCVPVADSLGELEKLERAARDAGLAQLGVGVRIHPDFTMYGGDAVPAKFGVDYAQADDLLRTLRACPHLRMEGIHVHVQSQVLDADALGRFYTNCYQLAEDFSARLGTPMRFIDFGSGVGVVFDAQSQQALELDVLAGYTRAIAARNRKRLRARLLIETGRFVTCTAGTFYTPVVDVKQSHGKTFVVVKNGINGFMRPAVTNMLRRVAPGAPAMEPFYSGETSYVLTVPGSSAPLETVTVAGNLCTGMDVIAEDVTLSAVREGDLIAISHAGAYARSFSALAFASHPLPGEYLL